MTYPINMKHEQGGGYAVANDAAEHGALSAAGYEPKLFVLEPLSAKAKAANERRTASLNKLHALTNS